MTIERMKLSRLGAFVRRGGAVVLVPLLFTVVCSAMLWMTTEDLRLLKFDGVDTTATVVAKYEERGKRTNGEGRTKTYHVEVRFTDSRDRLVTQRAAVGPTFHLRVDEGEEIPVRYVRQDPSIVEVDPKQRTRSVFWLGLIAPASLAWFIGGIWHYWRESARIYRAVNHGEIREARVTGHVSDANPQVEDTRKKAKRRYKLKWYDERDVFGMGGALNEDELAKYPEGTVIVTYADPVSGATFWEGQI